MGKVVLALHTTYQSPPYYWRSIRALANPHLIQFMPMLRHFSLRDKPGRDARYEVVDGEKALYLTGLNSFAEVPAVAFNPEGFTFMLWIKPLNQSFNFNPFIYSDWYPTATFYVILHVGYKSVFSRFKGLGSSDFLTYYLGFVQF